MLWLSQLDLDVIKVILFAQFKVPYRKYSVSIYSLLCTHWNPKDTDLKLYSVCMDKHLVLHHKNMGIEMGDGSGGRA